MRILQRNITHFGIFMRMEEEKKNRKSLGKEVILDNRNKKKK